MTLREVFALRISICGLPKLNLTLDRTSELRQKGFEGRRLGPKQMTTDTAVRVTRTIVQDRGEPLATDFQQAIDTGLNHEQSR